MQSYLGQPPITNPLSAEELTTREEQVLTLIVKGLTNPEIADKLVISAKIVDRHRENIMRKLNLHIQKDERVTMSLLAMGDGMTLCIKRPQ